MIFHNLQFLKNLCKVGCLISVHSATICLVSAMCRALFLTYQPLGECVDSYSPKLQNRDGPRRMLGELALHIGWNQLPCPVWGLFGWIKTISVNFFGILLWREETFSRFSCPWLLFRKCVINTVHRFVHEDENSVSAIAFFCVESPHYAQSLYISNTKVPKKVNLWEERLIHSSEVLVSAVWLLFLDT